jgi:hypothetical protein
MKIYAQIVFDWADMVPGMNWRNFRFIELSVEDDRIMGAVEGVIALLGIGLRLRWTYTVTETAQYIVDSVKEIENEHR